MPAIIGLIFFGLLFGIFNLIENNKKKKQRDDILKGICNGYDVVLEYCGICYFNLVREACIEYLIEHGVNAIAARQQIHYFNTPVDNPSLAMSRKILWLCGYIPSNMTGRYSYENGRMVFPQIPKTEWVRSPFTPFSYGKCGIIPDEGVFKAAVYFQNSKYNGNTCWGEWRSQYTGELAEYNQKTIKIMYSFFTANFKIYIRDYAKQDGCTIPENFIEWIHEKESNNE